MFAVEALMVVLFTGLVTSMAPRGTKKTAPVPVKTSHSSPKKKDFANIKVKQEDLNQKKKSSYFMKIVKLRPDFELIWIDASPGNDAYAQPLFDFVEKEDGFKQEGVIMVIRRRISQGNNEVLTNANNTYPRRCIIRMVDDSTHDSRLAILRAMQAYIMRPEHNKFGYSYVVNDASDLTPPNADALEPMDHFIQDDHIVNLILLVFEDTGETWFADNVANALDFFSGPNFPDYAMEKLGYPARISIAANIET